MNSGRRRTASVRKSSDPLADWARTIHRTNVTGLGTRRDYELAFVALAREQREALCARVPFHVGLRNNGVSIGHLGALGAYAPDEQLPQELSDRLAVINEVVEASGTQIVEMRQNGGERSEEFSVEGRMNAGILMVAVGDTDASLLRQTAWASDGKGGWKFSAVTEDAATRDGLSREDFECMVDDLGGVLPSVDSPAVVGARTIDQEAQCLAPGSWISYSTLSSLLRGH